MLACVYTVYLSELYGYVYVYLIKNAIVIIAYNIVYFSMFTYLLVDTYGTAYTYPPVHREIFS